MAIVKIVLRKDKSRANGAAPLYMRITKHRRSKYVSLKLDVLPELWDEEACRVKKGYPNQVSVNHFLAVKEAEAMRVSLDSEAQDAHVNSKELKAAISGRSSPSFFTYAAQHMKYLKATGKSGTLDKAKAVVSKVKFYMNGRDLLLAQINVSWLRAYETYLRGELKNCNNTVHSNLKVIRGIINRAVEEEILPYEKNPFHRFKLKWEQTSKVFLTVEELIAIRELEINPEHRLAHHRDMFVFACLAGGLRVSDLLFLKWKNVQGDRLLLQMEKTGDQVMVPLTPAAKEILSRYKKLDSQNSDFVFPLVDSEADMRDPNARFKMKSSQTAYYNKNLKLIAEMAGIDKPITSHTARHTFGTIALRNGIRLEHVSKLLGHKNIKTTQVYAKIVNEDLEESMKRMNF